MKLAIVFEVPDDGDGIYAPVAADMIRHHQFATEQRVKHWSFDIEMRPIAAATGDSNADLVAAVSLALEP